MGTQFAWRLYEDMADAQDEIAPEPFPHFRRAQMLFSRATPAGTTEDKAVITVDLLKFNSSGPVSNWDTADYVKAETALDAFVSANATRLPNTHQFVGYRWYRRRFAHPNTGKKYIDEGGPARVISKSIVGSNSTVWPYQFACTITERTPMPKHWGRIYTPFVGGTLDTGGRFSNSHRSAVASSYLTALQALLADGLAIVVPVTQIDKQPVRGLLGLTHVQVDDVPDVQRRRRAKQTAARSILPAP